MPDPVIPWEGSQWPPRKWQAEALPVVIDAMKRGVPAMVAAVMGAGKSILQAEVGRLALPKLAGRAIVYTVPRLRLVDQLAATLRERLGAHVVGTYSGRRKQPDRPVIVCCNASLPALGLDLAAAGRAIVLLIADEAHGTEASTLRDTIPTLAPRCLLGFTATPFRSVPEESISLFREIVYRYSITDAVRDGVLVEPRVVRFKGTQEPGELDQVCLDMLREHGDGPGIVSAVDIQDAEDYAAWLTGQGFDALAIHSRHRAREQEDRLAQLRDGKVRALVHVSLLAEGVDLPWLRWICLRRHVSARVRFLQEVGRVLRVDRNNPGKVDGVIMDPHLLLGQHGWTSAEAIGEALEQAAAAEESEPSTVRGTREVVEHEAIALDLLLAYLESARAELEQAGVIKGKAIDPGGWQIVPVSEKQVDAIKSAGRLTRHIPGEHREAIRALTYVPWALTRGQASDLLDVLYGGARWCRTRADARGVQHYRVQWPAGRLTVEQPDEAAIKSIAKLGRRVKRQEAKA